MSEHPSPERVQILDDNARKFVVKKVHPNFVYEFDTTSYIMTTDWLVTDEDSETKLAHKVFDDGHVQILHISKHTVGGKRVSRKEEISSEEYNHLLESSILRLKKKRYEFEYIQNGVNYDVKLDEFIDSELTVLEVDAEHEEDRLAFDASDFPAELSEVTGDISFYGYRAVDTLKIMRNS